MQDFDGLGSQAITLARQPLLEAGLAQAHAVEEIAAVESRRLLERLRRRLRRQLLELAHVDRHGVGIHRDSFVGRREDVLGQHAAERKDRLPHTMPRLLFTDVGPEQRGESAAAVGLSWTDAEYSQQSLDLLDQRLAIRVLVVAHDVPWAVPAI